MRQYDKNKNGVLERDEWTEMKGKWRDADANGDGTITLDELTAKLSNFSQSRPSAGSGSSSGTSASAASRGAASSSGAAASGEGTGVAKKSYRFLSPQERLPRGLPDWFLRKDADGDGQVAMAEYASSGWSEALAEEFTKHDLNGDGVITPEECLKAANAR